MRGRGIPACIEGEFPLVSVKNLGEWQGSFTRLSPSGVELSSTPSILSLEGLENNKLVKFRLRRYDNWDYQDPPLQDYSQDYFSLGRQAVFFDTGAFSKGPWQFAPFSEFGAEFGFVDGDRRLRFVQFYNKQSQLDSLTLIREFRQGTQAQERPPLQLEQLLGVWPGQACIAYADWRPPELADTQLTFNLEGDRLEQSFTCNRVTTTVQGLYEQQQITFTEPTRGKFLLLPDGVSSCTPDRLELGQPFCHELAWLVRPGERQRLIRHYDAKGAWSHSLFVVEYLQG